MTATGFPGDPYEKSVFVNGFRDGLFQGRFNETGETEAARSIYASGFAVGMARRAAGGMPAFDVNKEIAFLGAPDTDGRSAIQSLISLIAHLLLRVESLEARLGDASHARLDFASMQEQQLELFAEDGNIFSGSHWSRPLPPTPFMRSTPSSVNSATISAF